MIPMMFGFGDVDDPMPETADVLEVGTKKENQIDVETMEIFCLCFLVCMVLQIGHVLLGCHHGAVVHGWFDMMLL